MRDVAALTPSMQVKARALVNALKAAGIAHTIIETLRTMDTQKAYFAQGREPLDIVNEKRRIAGLAPISVYENKRIITKTLNSRHLDGEAFDLVPLDRDSRPWWKAPDSVWLLIGSLGESVGLEWGGRWGQAEGRLGWDCPHFQERA